MGRNERGGMAAASRNMIFFPVCLSGQGLIISASRLRIPGLLEVRTLALWISAVFRKMLSICTKANGLTNRCCTFFRIGIGKRAIRLMLLPIPAAMRWNCFSIPHRWVVRKKTDDVLHLTWRVPYTPGTLLGRTANQSEQQQ